MTELPVGTVTFLFTDIEGSTQLLHHRGDRSGITTVLKAFATVGASQRQAAHLFGAASELREAIGAPIMPFERDAHEELVAATRAALGEADFATAWPQGRAMPTDEAIEYALNACCPA